MRKLRTSVCERCKIEFQSRAKNPRCCSKLCSNKIEGEKRKTVINPETGLTKAQEISLKSSITMKENGWYGSPEHIKSLSHAPDVRVKRGKNIRKTHLSVDESTGKTRAALAAEKQIQTKISKGLYLDPSLKSDFEKYVSKVRNLSEKNDLSHLENFEKRGRAGIDGAFHLDHIYSIKMGFQNNIEPEIISSVHNLRFIPAEINISKKDKSEISIEELLSVSIREK